MAVPERRAEEVVRTLVEAARTGKIGDGRVFLYGQMDRQGLRYRRHDNGCPWVEDYERAQRLLDRQLRVNWPSLLNQIAAQLNPQRSRMFARPPRSTRQARQRSAAISRKLRLLRAHGLIRKVPHTHRYLVTAAGRKVILAALTSRQTTLQALNALLAQAA